MRRVLLGFSGGVDSAVSAMLLKEAGWQVSGLYLDNSDKAALEFALASAESMKLPLEVCDVKAELEKKVCSAFAAAYLRGRTPNPCILCNPSVKFAKLLEAADAAGAQFAATGHYARVCEGKLYRGKPANDQSYMLCRLTPAQLSRCVFPLGEFEKSKVRELAAGYGLASAGKPDSMEICFIPDKDYVGWLSRRAQLPPEGRLVFRGQTVGTHRGIHCYTVGQRYPGLIEGEKVYVSRIDPEENTVELSRDAELMKTEFIASSFNWQVMPDRIMENCSVRVRHTRKETPGCSAELLEDGKVKIYCTEPVRAPAPGQSAVLYRGDLVLGGGFIE